MKSKALKNLILEICEVYPIAANNDTALTEAIWIRQGWDFDSGLYENLTRVTDQATIKRRRRQLHEEGKLEYSPEVERKRYNQFKENVTTYIPEGERSSADRSIYESRLF